MRKLIKPKHLAIFILSLSFFAFVDDRQRGWWDTNQYFIEAQAWFHKTPPPVPDLVENTNSSFAPAYSPPLTPYVWSFIHSEDQRTSLKNVRILQALLLCFLFLGISASLGWAIMIPVLFFYNQFFRELIFWPMTEPLSLFLLMLPYFVPGLGGFAAGLQIVTRPAVAFLHLPNLWPKLSETKKAWQIYLGAILALVFDFAIFGKTVIPAKPPGVHFALHKLVEMYKAFAVDVRRQLFMRLLPQEAPVWDFIFLVAVSSATVFIFYKLRKRPIHLVAISLYVVVISLPPPFALGVRYFSPLLLFFILELRPRISKTWVLRFAVFLLCCHLVIQQGDRINDFVKDHAPNADTVGLNKARDWLHTQNLGESRVIMSYVRYCLNFFQVRCVGYASLDVGDPGATLVEKKIKYFLTTGQAWIAEEPVFERKLKSTLKASDQDWSAATHAFDEVRIIDLESLLKKTTTQ